MCVISSVVCCSLKFGRVMKVYWESLKQHASWKQRHVPIKIRLDTNERQDGFLRSTESFHLCVLASSEIIIFCISKMGAMMGQVPVVGGSGSRGAEPTALREISRPYRNTNIHYQNNTTLVDSIAAHLRQGVWSPGEMLRISTLVIYRIDAGEVVVRVRETGTCP